MQPRDDGRTVAPARPVTEVLIVDDDPDINRLLQLRLEARGFHTAGVHDGRTALAHLATHTTDVVFLDIALPGMNGLEVLNRIRQRSLDVAVILMTAFGSEETAVAGLRAAADDYLPKPFRADEFEAVLQRTVDRLNLTRRNAELSAELAAKNEALEQELARAGEIQAGLLPRRSPDLPGFELAARCLPASSVAGDFYDWQTPAPGVLTLTVCDVMGHGMPAALMMATVRAVTRTVTRLHPPAEALAETARTLGGDLDRSSQFVTAFVAVLDTKTRMLRFADAGHGLALLRRADGTVDPPHHRGLPLGLFPDAVYADVATTMFPGDALVVYSDGLAQRRSDWLTDHDAVAGVLDGMSSAADGTDRLLAAARPIGPSDDDMTVAVLWCRPTED